MRGWILLIGLAFSTTAARGEDVSWTSAVSLWKSLSIQGQVVDAGPAPSWESPPPAATLGQLPLMPRLAPIGTPRPSELPEEFLNVAPRLVQSEFASDVDTEPIVVNEVVNERVEPRKSPGGYNPVKHSRAAVILVPVKEPAAATIRRPGG